MNTNFTEALQSLDFIKKSIENAYEKGYRMGLKHSDNAYLQDKTVQKIAEKHYSSVDIHPTRWVFTDKQLFAFVKEVTDEVHK